MSLFLVLLQLVFGLCLLVLVYVYIGFPVILWIATRRRALVIPSPLPDRDLPSVSFLVAVYNEEVVIETKIANCLSIDYPQDKVTYVFVSDSIDSTNELLLKHASEQIQVHILPKRIGKVGALCSVIPGCTSDLLVFTDANTYYRPDALRKLVRHFQNAQVGVVTGDVRLMHSEERFGVGEGLYYRYERGLQVLESRFWSTVAVDGAMYALRRENFQPPRVSTVGDDLVIGMNVGLRGLRIIYDPEAIADEPATPSDELEFRRKIRIVAYGIQACLHREGIPSLGQWQLLWIFLSHKVLRWLAPLFLLLALMASLVAAVLAGGFWIVVFGIQLLFYCLAAIAWRFPSARGFVFRIPYYFSMVNLAAFLGTIRGMRKKQAGMWQVTERASELPKGAPNTGDN